MNIKPSDISLKKRFPRNFWMLTGILMAVTIISTLILSPGLMVMHITYELGDIADKNIKATSDFFVEDKAATRLQRETARDSVLTVYDYDKAMADKLERKIKAAFLVPRSVFDQPPQAEADSNSKEIQTLESKIQRPADRHAEILRLKPEFESTIGIPVDSGAYKILENEKFSEKTSNLIISILSQILGNGVVANKDLLLQENDKGIVLKTIGTDSEMVVRNLKQFYGLDQAKSMARIVGEPVLKNIDYTIVNLIVDFTQRLILPNITPNRSETEKRKIQAESSVNPILYKIQQGEMILREGERVTPLHLVKLNALKEQTGKKQAITKAFGTGLIIFALMTITYLIHLKYQRKILHYQNKNLFFIGSVVIIFLLILQFVASLAQTLAPESSLFISPASVFYSIPLAAGPMTICQFLGFNIAFPFAIVLSLISAIIFENSYEMCLYFLLNGIMGAFWVQNCKERKGFIKAGVKLGLLNILLTTIIDIYMIDFSGFKLPWDWTFAFAGGVVAGIITAGLTPLMELMFGYTTDSSMLELANLDQPLLRRLMLEAPGTYHHSVIVGSLVEAAASEIGANPLLAKVCGYYHDIGKLKNPMYFIENQKDGKNIHNKLAPSMSCLILTSHVKNGIELAREKKIGQQIIDAINQHHGTTLISFFYNKAKQQAKEDQVVNMDNFRYPGPKPQTRETALVMLADVVEAASRTLENPTPALIQGLVAQLINKLFSDNQLDECPLTLKDLNNIARSFNKILNGIYHHRIEYPDKLVPGESKEKNENTDRQPANPAETVPEPDTEEGPNTLKRLGQS
ncbi:MAG: HD family phosphohydrolase [Desulfobacterales bacterium CG23_combo_of_CG06-09_8_20_14_all_51_8]|nr:MAG: HD family phosphohydrolase [Desulfobacterales bacterium CG23_combo_of_CG06-09_8_20_14_all_51_8]